MTAAAVYRGSDGEVTKALYAELERIGPAGQIAMNLFRAQKCSERAKLYRGRRYKDAAYERKNWSMGLLCGALRVYAVEMGIRWGWGQDLSEPFAPWVLYVDLPQGQVSFHSTVRLEGPDYPDGWDHAAGASPMRILGFVEAIRAGVPGGGYR